MYTDKMEDRRIPKYTYTTVATFIHLSPTSYADRNGDISKCFHAARARARLDFNIDAHKACSTLWSRVHIDHGLQLLPLIRFTPMSH